MKKLIITGILLSSMMLGNTTVFALENNPMSILSTPTSNETIIGTPKIIVNGENVDLTNSDISQYILEEKGNTLVPLRAVAEKMGFTVNWVDKNQAITVGNDVQEVLLYIGLDSYIAKSKAAIGTTAPQSYGTAPQLINGTLFVPANMFELLGYTYNAIGEFVNFEKADALINNSQIPNPFVTYENMDSVKEALSFNPAVPSVLPQGYELNEISSISSDFLQIIYKNDKDNSIYYRTAQGSDDISGDYNKYKINKEVKVGNLTVTVYGNDKISNAQWINGEFTFSIFSDIELEETEVKNIIENIK